MGLGEGIGSAGHERAPPGPPGLVSPMTGTRVPPRHGSAPTLRPVQPLAAFG